MAVVAVVVTVAAPIEVVVAAPNIKCRPSKVVAVVAVEVMEAVVMEAVVAEEAVVHPWAWRSSRKNVHVPNDSQTHESMSSHAPGERHEHNGQVRKIEDETIRTLQAKGTALMKTAAQARMPLRPGYGTQGRPVMLWANYFEMAAPMDLVLFRYSIEILPAAGGRVPVGRKAKRVIEILCEEHFAAYQHILATDCKSNLICKSELPLEEQGYVIQHRLEDEDDPPPSAPSYKVRLQPTGTLSISELMDYLTSSNASELFGSKEEIIQALNIVMGHYPKVSRHIFSKGANRHFSMTPEPFDIINLGGGLQAVRGFFVSVRAATCRILLNVQVAHTPCYEGGPLGLLMDTFLRQNGGNMFRLANFVKKLRVQVTHIVRKNRVGQEVARIKTVAGLASPGDGPEQDKPPIVPKYGAGPTVVKFHLGTPGESSEAPKEAPAQKTGKRGKIPAKKEPQATGDGYISVSDFFKQSTLLLDGEV